MKTLLLYRDPFWWIWLVTAIALAAGLAGLETGFRVAVLLSLGQAVWFYLGSRSLRESAVQIRVAYVLLLLAALPESMHWLYWLPMLGTFALVLFGYCLLARSLSLLPWNRTGPLTWSRFRRTIFSPPVATREAPPASAPALGCPGGVCVIESYAGDGD